MNNTFIRILIVDDEENTRNLIRRCIDWDEIGIEIAGEASSGQEALDMLEKINIDIVITDIRMQFMDGLEFSKRTIKRFPYIKIIVLTAYEEFEYAQEGIKIGISDFLLKPIKRAKLKESVSSLKSKIETERMSRAEYIKLKERLSENFLYLKEKFLNDLIQRSYSSENIIDKILYFSVESITKYIQVALIGISHIDNEEFKSEEDSVLLDLACAEIVKKYFQDYEDVHVIIDNSRKIVILNSNPKIDIIFSCEKIKELLINRLNCYVSVGIGNAYKDLKNIKKSYREAFEALNYKVVYGKNQVICFNDISIDNHGLDVKNEETNELGFYIKAGIDEKSRAIIDKIFKDIDTTKNYNIGQVRVLSINIVTMVFNSITELGLDYEQMLENKDFPYNSILKIDKITEMREYLIWFILNATKFIKGARAKKVNKVFVEIAEYIKKNISDPELSLSSIANKFYLNPSYLSRVFKQEIGYSFIEYLTKIRIEKAIELLKETDLRNYEVCEKIGVPDPNYFGKCFKKYTGISVSDFKKAQII
ncbi:two-component system response regulator YesN [Clostridium saccharoperbutylacetonicum]|uniref:Stage 0 sporulation protein A homolog n=1 Tax=Clostridium saccharoperbutylacetonicum N1-4(HMT) TaxID=931276 RepID=M1N5B5_9CLOT|nr:response regulator [Clostridium saccharoperbutylacetonicum]AGF58622.1 response regulator containing CheY-like receiver domain and AraC-type DNA-binding domain [Clostridium saccharoperbutylacetonicum N1-4(HMT)]NRT60599.1 two-component system response regulator YesN [Clostridium saccharoperbutylacetonicum]NSB23913.1 two-component system response regulator YesN [Clostridium saccharoperbutylacetonicum]NSB43289.1 two-component system response regulator YesN [Clostridium saccharoperbutylacetonicum